MTSRTWSPYQLAIHEAFADDSAGNLVVDAKAGSGKSTTCAEGITSYTGGKHQRYLAFNRVVAQDFMPRVNNCEVKTFNAFGHGAYCAASRGRVTVNKDKNFEVMKQYNLLQGKDFRELRGMTNRLISLCKNNLVFGDDIEGIASFMDDYSFVFDSKGNEKELVMNATSIVLLHALDTADSGIIDFDDQLYITLLKNMPLPRTERLFVDEAQDLNHARMTMCERMLTLHGRIFIIGDPHQAIYGFQGAHKGAIDHMTQHFNAKVLPLSVSYRCPQAIVVEAQKYVPSIEYAENAKPGLVTTDKSWNLEDFAPQDLVLCRLNAPLISLALKFLKVRKPCYIAGREFGEVINRHFKIVCKQHKEQSLSKERGLKALHGYKSEEVEKARERNRHGLAHVLEDQIEASITILNECVDTDEARDVVDKLFSSTGGTRLSTVHRAKGSEARRVFILEPHLMPFPKANPGWEMEQEYNLLYVAITRAMEELHYITKENIQ